MVSISSNDYLPDFYYDHCYDNDTQAFKNLNKNNLCNLNLSTHVNNKNGLNKQQLFDFMSPRASLSDDYIDFFFKKFPDQRFKLNN